MSKNEHFYPYRIATNDQNMYGDDLTIYQFQNQINLLQDEINHINNKIENDHNIKKLYQSIIKYVDNKCDSFNNNERGRILTGNGAPSDNLGENGSFYLDNDTGNYYIKILGRWIQRGNLMGPPGSRILAGNGRPNNELGNIGDFYIDNVTKVYYIKVPLNQPVPPVANNPEIVVTADGKKEPGIWVPQGAFAASSGAEPLTLPILFSANVFIPSVSSSTLPNSASGAIATNNNTGIVTSTNTNDVRYISYSTNSFYVYTTPTELVLPTTTTLTFTVTNLIDLKRTQAIQLFIYFNVPNVQEPNTFVDQFLNGRKFPVSIYYDNDTPANTTLSASVRIYDVNTGGSLIFPAGTSIIFIMYGINGYNGQIPTSVTVNLA